MSAASRLTAAATVLAGLTLGLAGAAQGARLDTSATSGTAVTTGTTATAASAATFRIEHPLGAPLLQQCTTSSLSLTVLDNGSGSGTVSFAVTGSAWSGCSGGSPVVTGDHAIPWAISYGAADGHAPGQCAGRWSSVRLLVGASPFTGGLVDAAFDPTPADSHVAWDDNGAGAAEHELDAAEELRNPLVATQADGRWSMQGAAAGWAITGC